MNINTARITIIQTHIAAGGSCKSSDCEAAVLALASDDATRKAAKFAFNNGSYNLKARGCIASVARGTWQVTDAGRKFAADGTLPPVAADAPDAPETAKVEATPEAAPVVTPEVAPEAPKRLKVANAPSTNPVVVPEWLNDDAIRGLVIENSECYGAWSAKSQSCGECPLVGWCRNSKAATLTLLASKITVAAPALVTPPPVSKAVAKLDATVSKVNSPDATRTVAVAEGPVMKATFDGTCAITGKPITKGDAVKYIPKTGIVLV